MQAILSKALAATESAWPVVRRAFSWVHRAAVILRNKKGLDGAEVRRENFTNLGAVGGKFCFHKGINALWVLRQCMEGWGAGGTAAEWEELLAAADREPAPGAEELLPMDAPALLGMGQRRRIRMRSGGRRGRGRRLRRRLVERERRRLRCR